MKIDTIDFRIPEGGKVRLDKRPTKVPPLYRSKAHYATLLSRQIEKLRSLQPVLYAHNRYALLVIFQALDAAGKDGAIKHVMSGVNPQGCQVFSFQKPSTEILEHDFLWNAARFLPERGRIGIFNRSYYEEVIVVRVHADLLRKELLPKETLEDKHLWNSRYRSIRNFERHLHTNGTRVVKFYLHLSKEEQRKRLLARLDDSEKNWKFREEDVEERELWDDYAAAYEKCLSATSTEDAPWYAVPADDKPNARLIISKILIETLSALPIHYPKIDSARRKELKAIRSKLESK